MTTKCYYTAMRLDYLKLVPSRFSLVIHFSDLAAPDMDTRQNGRMYGTTKTSPALQTLVDAGRLQAVHAMNMHFTNWQHKPRPSWLHCIPIGIRVRFPQPYSNIGDLVSAIQRNVVDCPRAFWSNSSRPLFLVSFTSKRYARIRAKARRMMYANVKAKALQWTDHVYHDQASE
jgi:hypothetical protein